MRLSSSYTRCNCVVLVVVLAFCAMLSLAYARTPALAEQPARDRSSSELRIVRIAHENLDRAPRDRLDPCSFEAAGAVLYLTEAEIAALEVPFERLGSVVEHTRRFRPNKTMAAVGVPSIAKLLGEPVQEVQVAGVRGVTHLEYDRYHSPQEGIEFYHSLAAAYPNITLLQSIGLSVEGRELWALKISDNPDLSEPDELPVFFTGLHHAREWATHEVMLYLAEYMVTRYDTDLRVRHIVDNAEVWLLLAANPDGFQYSWTTERYWRKNRANYGTGYIGVDLNRNYEYMWGYDNQGSSGNPWSSTYRGPSPASEPETQAIQAFLEEHKPPIAVSYHTYSQLVLYPWGYISFVNPEAYASMRGIADRYASIAGHVHGMTYTPGVAAYAIYPTNGDFTDYAYGAQGIMAYTPELRPASVSLGGFALPEEQILPNNEENLAVALWMMDNVADARLVPAPSGGFFSEGFNPFSLPLTPVNQNPQIALGMDETTSAHITAWLDDWEHNPSLYGTYPADFEGVGTGSGYRFEYTTASGPWAEDFAGYQALPYVFEDGAYVMLENVEAGPNYIGIPSETPVRMSEIRIIKRHMRRLDQTWGSEEVILEERTALEDLHDADPWISWQWTHSAADGTVEVSHPEGLDGADQFVHPYRSYAVETYVPSYTFWSSDPNFPVYLLIFPPPIRGDFDADGDVDSADYSTFAGCMTGPIQQVLTEPCASFDVDHDFDVDACDFSILQQQYGRGQ